MTEQLEQPRTALQALHDAYYAIPAGEPTTEQVMDALPALYAAVQSVLGEASRIGGLLATVEAAQQQGTTIHVATRATCREHLEDMDAYTMSIEPVVRPEAQAAASEQEEAVRLLMQEHRRCGPKYEGCYSHWSIEHCRADGMAWPCDVDRIRSALANPLPAADNRKVVERLARLLQVRYAKAPFPLAPHLSLDRFQKDAQELLEDLAIAFAGPSW